MTSIPTSQDTEMKLEINAKAFLLWRLIWKNAEFLSMLKQAWLVPYLLIPHAPLILADLSRQPCLIWIRTWWICHLIQVCIVNSQGKEYRGKFLSLVQCRLLGHNLSWNGKFSTRSRTAAWSWSGLQQASVKVLLRTREAGSPAKTRVRKQHVLNDRVCRLRGST